MGARIQLSLSLDPGQAEVVCNLLRWDDTYIRVTAVVDTGAEVSLLPKELLDEIEFYPSSKSEIFVQQAGIANQTFSALEGYIKLYFEERYGMISEVIEVKVWITETDQVLVGFEDILDRAVLHIDMPNLNGWLELNP